MSVVRARRAATHSFGLLNRLTSQSYTASAEFPSLLSVQYTYTPNGSLETVSEEKRTSATSTRVEQTTRTFDALERMKSQTRTYGDSPAVPRTTTFDYDVKGNRTLVQDFAGASTVYTFDSVDRLKTATTPTGSIGYSYWPDGLLKSSTHTAGSTAVTQQRCYFDNGQLKSMVSAVGPMNDDCTMPGGSSALRRFDYSYDPNNNRTRQDEMLGTGPAETTEYCFDDLDRLLLTIDGSEAKLYEFDPVGNRTGEKKTTPAAMFAPCSTPAPP